MDGKRIQCWSNAYQHIPIYLQLQPPLQLTRPRPVGCSHWNSGKKFGPQKTRIMGATRQWRQFDDRLSRFDTIPACDGRTDVTVQPIDITCAVWRLTTHIKNHIFWKIKNKEKNRRGSTYTLFSYMKFKFKHFIESWKFTSIRIAWKLVNFCNIIWWTVINFLFKNFIALWRHLAKTQLLRDAQINLYSVNKRQ